MIFLKYKVLIPAIGAIALLGGCADTPTQPTPVAPAANQVVQAIDNPHTALDCQTDTETGSHMRQRTVCISEEDRDAEARALSANRSRGNGLSSH